MQLCSVQRTREEIHKNIGSLKTIKQVYISSNTKIIVIEMNCVPIMLQLASDAVWWQDKYATKTATI